MPLRITRTASLPNTDPLVRSLMGMALLFSVCLPSARSASVPYFGDFERGAGVEWAPQVTNDSDVGRFTQFLGRLGPTTDVTLTLSGFTSGTSYTLGFDLYIIDSWDGGNTNSGDVFQVTADNVPLLLASRTNPK